MEQEKHDDWENMVNFERYHVMSEKEILERSNRENPSRNICTSDHATMAWENLEEPINENENDSEDYNSPENEGNLQEKKKLMMNSQNHLLQLTMSI